MKEKMTPRERWLAAIRLQPVDRLPFWPKLDNAYPPAQTAPFRDMDLEAIHEWIGSDQHQGIPDGLREVRKTTAVETHSRNGTRRTIYRTPRGETEQVQQFDLPSHSWHPVRFPVQTRADIALMTEVFDDVKLELDKDQLERAHAQARAIGSRALRTNSIGKSPLMYWIEWLAGVETAHFLLVDYPREVEALFDAIHRVLRQKTELLCEHSPADVLYLVENTSTTLISPAQYRRYCFAHIEEYGCIAQSAGRDLILHMCGHLKALLPDLAQVPAAAFEAFTSPTLGNTTLLDGRASCPDKCLIGGTNAVLWTRPVKEIIRRIEQDLDELPHHRGIVLTSAGVMPPLCAPETIRQVGEWVRSYPAKM